MLNSCESIIENALQTNPHCSSGLMMRQNVFSTMCGPSGASEILALIYADDPSFGYFYGHILQHPSKPFLYVAVIVWTKKCINAPTVSLLFKRFHYWIKDRLEYEPCTSQKDGDCYAENPTLFGSTHDLAKMIVDFRLEKRYGYDGSGHESDPVDLRVADIYGMMGSFDEQGRCVSSLPMPSPLSLVRNRP